MRMMTIQIWLEKLANIQAGVIFGLTKNLVDEEFIFAKKSPFYFWNRGFLFCIIQTVVLC